MDFDRRAIPAAARESMWAAPDGHPVRRLDWSSAAGPPRGSLLFLPGRGDYYEKHLEALHHWVGRGWRVTALDWRGQGGSGRLGIDEATGHVEDFALWLGDLAAFWGAWRTDSVRPRIVVAHSMGGQLALRAVAEDLIDPDALVLAAPMLGLAGRVPGAAMHQVARIMAAWGDARRPAWKWKEEPGDKLAWRQRMLTHDDARYGDELWWRQHRPELAMGPGSWRWVERAYASMRGLERPGVLERIAIPVILVASTGDKLVSFPAIERAARRIVRAELVRFGPEAAHEIFREADPVRTKALRRIDDFLDRVVPAEMGVA
ncbi:alpha/beta fold hydrolase [Novosphingobium sp. Gsoil 351]|uniref:alpha/beta fold hydrolase n=1 Tax=Novosphingobium sp. Gsoil 351 TaxID=2675225 RepID=UPI0012B4F127|nr:alpha/beta hydrolase [Novosphingobium sp. Gsoil 351]QGN55328.1 alpha/beta fold hydrolase [Novosphingobium sp. Gsoil 351]